MKPLMELAVELKLGRLNVICEALIIFTDPRIYHKIKHIKICENVNKVKVSECNPNNVLRIA
jgi:hypothetical protein